MFAGSLPRIIGTVTLMLLGWQIGSGVGAHSVQPRNSVFGIGIGALAGFVLSPIVIGWPYGALRRLVARMPAADLLWAIAGAILGLLMAALLAYPLSFLPFWFGHVLPAVTAAICASLGIALLLMRSRDLTDFLHIGSADPDRPDREGAKYLVDTSAIIDGRIADVSQTGFLHGEMLVPRFVLSELQHIAGSADPLRRNRGRRGLEILNQLQKDSASAVTICEIDARDAPDVDGKLVKLARHLKCPVVTNDFGLNRIAELQGVRVLNINELANALKPVVLPGEEMAVRIIQEGKEFNQGLAYLDDGTMIVVENGVRYLHRDLEIVVTRVLQTVAGRMIFACPKSNGRE